MAKEPKTYGELMTELDDVMAKLQEDGLDVDDAVDLYQRGLKLTDQLTTYLTESENKLTMLKQQND
ncbi:MAG TPA: exodeoxyribonuclease VII small subunit [Candidatus Saccharimonadales bacterium]|nr:exodeoxyribonuclease VII small subunit [Candidatus Saccharimonadales bacterium]